MLTFEGWDEYIEQQQQHLGVYQIARSQHEHSVDCRILFGPLSSGMTRISTALFFFYSLVLPRLLAFGSTSSPGLTVMNNSFAFNYEPNPRYTERLWPSTAPPCDIVHPLLISQSAVPLPVVSP